MVVHDVAANAIKRHSAACNPSSASAAGITMNVSLLHPHRQFGLAKRAFITRRRSQTGAQHATPVRNIQIRVDR